jgi:hypothetical protein
VLCRQQFAINTIFLFPQGTVNSKSARKTRRRKSSTSKGKEMNAEKCNPHPQAEDREEL